jgi:hypothetical protein
VDVSKNLVYGASMRHAWGSVAVALILAFVVGVGRSSDAGAASAVWLSTRTSAQHDLLGSRFPNIYTARCLPDKRSASKVFGTVRWWQRFWCSGRTRDAVNYRLLYHTTGKCDACWTITNLTGTGVAHLRTARPLVRPKPKPKPTAPSSGNNTTPSTGSCPSGWYRNVDGNCIPGPSNDPGLLPGGPTAICRDGTYSYSQHHSGTCSHHGGVARWL